MFLWCQRPDHIDAAELTRKALIANIVLAPGNAFSVSQTAAEFMRFNVTQVNEDALAQLSLLLA